MKRGHFHGLAAAAAMKSFARAHGRARMVTGVILRREAS